MRLGMIGLGRMGRNMTRRLLQKGHECVVFDIHAAVVTELQQQGALGAVSAENLVSQLQQPRILWLMLPAALVDQELAQLIPLLAPGDIIIDGGNSYYHDDIRRSSELQASGIHHVDVGTSGGVFGLERGYCLMIGGDADIAQYLAPIFSALAPGRDSVPVTPHQNSTDDRAATSAEEGYLHCGAHGAGHFVKMVHNGIEYGLMAAYAEGLNILHNANIGNRPSNADAETTPLRNPEYYQYTFALPDIVEVWRRGSVIGSWLLDLTAIALHENPDLSHYAGRVSDSGEGRWTVAAALDEGVPVPVISAALFERFQSRGNADYADRLLSAMRKQFGGHDEKKEEGH